MRSSVGDVLMNGHRGPRTCVQWSPELGWADGAGASGKIPDPGNAMPTARMCAVSRRIPNTPGKDRISFTARQAATGETCRGAVILN